MGGFAGTDGFGYVVSDGMGGSASYHVRIDVAAVARLVAGTAADDVLAAGGEGDGYSGGAGNDRITGGAGDDVIDGGSGIDTAFYGGRRSGCTLVRNDSHRSLSDEAGNEGTDRLVAVERLTFGDTRLALSTATPALPPRSSARCWGRST